MEFMDENSGSFPFGGSEDSNSNPLNSLETGVGGEKRKFGEGQGDLPMGLLNGNGAAPPAKRPLLEEVETQRPSSSNRTLLPELEKFWGPVEKDPNDFTAWTQLLQYVDSENEVSCAREAYSTFLRKYPYCYGYWKKFADYERRKGSPEHCEQVFARGLKAISLSVDLWIHYLNYVKVENDGLQPVIRSQFEKAIAACGLEFRSDKLWEHYIQWEKDNGNLAGVLRIYDRVLATPTQNYQTHLQHVKEFISLHRPEAMLSQDELLSLKKELDEKGENLDDEGELGRLRELMIEKRTEIYKKNEADITARWPFEEAIKRPYFHVKPLEKGQLRKWKEYLDFEIGHGEHQRIIILFERCLIACALYEEYWMKYARFMIQMNRDGNLTSDIEDVFNRACIVHHPGKPWINLLWASWEEEQGRLDKAIEILDRVEAQVQGSLIIPYRRINLERRRGNYSRCAELWRGYIEEAKVQKNMSTLLNLSVKYAHFLNKVLGEYEAAKSVLKDFLETCESGEKARAVMAIVELGIGRIPVDIELVASTFEEAIGSSSIPDEQKVTFIHRKIEFLEDYGRSVEEVNKAQDELQNLAKNLREKKVAQIPGAPTSNAGTDGANGEAPSSATNGTSTSAPTTTTPSFDANSPLAYGQQYNQYGSYANWDYSQSSGYGYTGEGWNAYQGYYGSTESSTTTGG